VTVPKVEIGFSGPGVDASFRLDDAVRGALDAARLGPVDTLVDVSARLVAIATDRGKTELTSPVSAGRAVVTLRNRDGALDPLNTSSIYFPGVEPQRSLNVYADGVQIFAGFVDSIDLDYGPGGEANVTVSATDGLARIGQTTLPTAGVPVSAEDSGARVLSVLGSGTYWSGGTAIDTGDSTLATGTATGNLLTYLQKVERSEGGLLFAGRTGALEFRDRNYAADDTSPLTLADNGSGIPYQLMARVSGDADFYNGVLGTVDDVTYEAQNTESQENYGQRTLDLGDLLLDSGQQDRIDWELIRRERIYPTVRAVEVFQTAPIATAALPAELGDRASIVFTPPGVGELTQDSSIVRVAHNWVEGQPWRTTIGVRSIEQDPLFVLDDATLGALGTGRLTF
jgi:hypothetical protein